MTTSQLQVAEAYLAEAEKDLQDEIELRELRLAQLTRVVEKRRAHVHAVRRDVDQEGRR